MNPHYYFRNGRFVVEQYNDLAPFASFLPGIAGMHGRPAWVFYVNRGQAIASFGVRNKDGAFLEFFPADKAYQLTAARGFRTFLKIGGGNRLQCYEPFQRNAGEGVMQRLYVAPHEVGVEEIHPNLGLHIRADMFTLPEAEVAGLLRRVEITNTSNEIRCLEIVDGLPQVLPYAMNQWILKFMSRTSEAFMRVEGVAERLPFYRLKVWPTDTPQVDPVQGGNFFAGFAGGQLNRVIVDPERVFGLAGDFSTAERFFSAEPLDFASQVMGNQTPSAFQHLAFELQPGESRVFYGAYGHAESMVAYQAFVAEAGGDEYFVAKRELNRQLVEGISQRAFTSTAKPLFDAHAQQCYLDNGLRGGFPQRVPGGAHLYLFGRKHGDLERDYNDFLLQDAPFSEGNGDFRDVLQNRRVDLFFEPALGDKNIRYFFNLIQPDGYNPCSLRNSRFWVATPQNLAGYFAEFPALSALLTREFKYTELWQALRKADGCADEGVLEAVLAEAEAVEDAEFDRGYWSDHWTYLVDLLVNFQTVFPERVADLVQAAGYTFFDPTHSVAPRAHKYQLTPQGLRQYGAVRFSEDKKALIESRSHRRYQVRDNNGQGDIIHTTLLGKILTLVANKLATLDPCGVGIEMEADRPGWCDALNGLPGILGSAVNETIELKRLVDFTLIAAADAGGDCVLPAELADFIRSLDGVMRQPELSALAFWRQSGQLKEAYRAAVFTGFAGRQYALSIAEVCDFLSGTSDYLAAAIDKARTPAGITTYFSYDAEQYRQLDDGAVEVERFRQKSLPLFLEGFVHALRVADPTEAQRLYAAARASQLYDRKLGMYRLNEPLGDDALELGRIGVFNYGWLENGSIFLHMHYKFVLEMVRAGLADQFYAEMERLLVAFRDPNQYKRNPVENSSFLVNSGFSVDPRQHGRGCVARLSGSTVEFLQLWTLLFFGSVPFTIDAGALCFQPRPILAEAMFSTKTQSVKLFGVEETLPADSAACALFGSTLVVYQNPRRRNTYGEQAVQPVAYHLTDHDGRVLRIENGAVSGETAADIRRNRFRRIDVLLGDPGP